jgi:[acyl-carrier-protein] S-malonyltransferase
MARFLLENFPKAKQVFEEAEDACRLSLRSLCLDGPESELVLTEHTQPVILTASVATWVVLQDEAGFNAKYFAGHSLGEYSALVAAGKLSLTTAAKLVRQRGKEMQLAVPLGKGAMLAVLGTMDLPVLEEVCRRVSSELKTSGLDSLSSSVQVANYNSPSQVILSGGAKAIDAAALALEALKFKTKVLTVSAPFHSSLMAPARLAMEASLKDLKLPETEGQIIANITGNVEPKYTSDFLIQQIDGPVKWTQTIETALQQGAQRFIEVGPGKVLSGMVKRSLPKEAVLIATDDIKESILKLTQRADGV